MAEVWFGTNESFAQIADLRKQVVETRGIVSEAMVPKVGLCGDDDEDRDGPDYNGYRWKNPIGYSREGNIAVISVEGGTESKTSWITRLLGIATYEDIRYRFEQAYEDSEVNAVLLKLDTPGGMAKGAFAMSDYIAAYNRGVKPVVSFTDGAVASAGVLYGTSATAMLADPYAEVGSIGAIVVFMDHSAMLKQIGIGVHVTRSGPYKGVPNRYEKLSDKGEEVLEEMVQRGHDQFVATLSRNLSIPIATLNEKIANGKMWAAPEALSLGLINGTTTYEKLVATMQSKYQNKPTTAARSFQTKR